MRLADYIAQIEAWEKFYGKPRTQRVTDLTQMKVSCDKCGKIKKQMHRHHIANDFMFALMRPDLYAARYIQFHPDDVRRLCNRCHRAVHSAYTPLVNLLDIEISTKGTACVTQKWCEKWRERFRATYLNWRLETKREEKKHGTQTGVRVRKRRKGVRRTGAQKRSNASKRDSIRSRGWPPDESSSK